MELMISIIAVVVSVVTFLFSVLIEYRGEQREKKQATLDAINILQEQVFDNINKYKRGDFKFIAQQYYEANEARDAYCKENNVSKNEFWKTHHEYDDVISEYNKISVYMARIEHFSLGVNTGIYDVKVTERATTKYFRVLYDKLKPILDVKKNLAAKYNKNPGENSKKSDYEEFEKFIGWFKKIENKV